MRFTDYLIELPLELRRPVSRLEGAERLLIEVPLPLDVGILEAVRPRAELARARFAERSQI